MLFQDAIGQLKPQDEEGVTVVIETPMGSRQKYDVDHDTGLFKWALELPEGVTFPFSFGFVPNTLAEDGDPLDIMLLIDGEIPQGTVVKARLVGVLQAEQDEGHDGEAEMVRNDRIVAVANLSRVYTGVRSLDDLRPGLMWEFEQFFITYNKMIKRDFRVLDRGSAAQAQQMLVEAVERANKG